MIRYLGGDRYWIDVNPGRRKQRVRRIVRGTRETAKRVVRAIHDRVLAEQFGWPQPRETKVRDVVRLVVQDYEDNDRKSVQDAREIAAFWESLSGGKLADDVSGDMLLDWARGWQRGGLTPARCNRRIAMLRRGYRLAANKTPPLVSGIPPWTRLAEAPARVGFFEWERFVSVRNALPRHARLPVTIAYWTGMRAGETHGLLWKAIRLDRKRKVVFIQLDRTKNNEPRLIAMQGDLYNALNAAREEADEDCPWVCQYRGARLRSVRTTGDHLRKIRAGALGESRGAGLTSTQVPRPADPRSASDRRSEHGQRWRVSEGGDGGERAQNGERVQSLSDRL